MISEKIGEDETQKKKIINTSNAIYIDSRDTSTIIKPKLTKHHMALTYLNYSRISNEEQIGNPYLSFSKLGIKSKMKEQKQLDLLFLQLINRFNEIAQKTQKQYIENLKEFKSIVFLALSLKVSSPNNQIWSQQAWGYQHYIKIITIIINQINQLQRINQVMYLKKTDYRLHFFKNIQQLIFTQINGQSHPNGIKQIIHEEVYCFIATYYNFSQNQLLLEQKEKNNNRYNDGKSNDPRKKHKIN